MHHLILEKIRACEVKRLEIRRLGIENFKYIFECKKVKKYLDNPCANTGIHKVNGVRSLIGDHHLSHIHKGRPRILVLFAVCQQLLHR